MTTAQPQQCVRNNRAGACRPRRTRARGQAGPGWGPATQRGSAETLGRDADVAEGGLGIEVWPTAQESGARSAQSPPQRPRGAWGAGHGEGWCPGRRPAHGLQRFPSAGLQGRFC